MFEVVSHVEFSVVSLQGKGRWPVGIVEIKAKGDG